MPPKLKLSAEQENQAALVDLLKTDYGKFNPPPEAPPREQNQIVNSAFALAADQAARKFPKYMGGARGIAQSAFASREPNFFGGNLDFNMDFERPHVQYTRKF